eukprot:1769661-Pyramimonas_sp.AAC.1
MGPPMRPGRPVSRSNGPASSGSPWARCSVMPRVRPSKLSSRKASMTTSCRVGRARVPPAKFVSWGSVVEMSRYYLLL